MIAGRRLGLVGLVAIATGASAQTPGTGFDVQRYAVTLRPDLATTAVSATQSIQLRVTADKVTQLAFSPNAMTISAATLNDRAVAVALSRDAVTFNSPRALRRGERATLRFRYEGTPKRGITTAAGGVYSAYFACDWMICLQDSPGDKADFSLDLLLPVNMISLGVGRAAKTIPAGGGLARHRWRSTRPYSPYLFAFAAGPFERRAHASSQGELVYLDATGAKPDLAAAFAATADIAAFFTEKAGVPLPDRRYIQLLTSDRAAQETASFSLIGKAELDDERADPSSAWVIAHELAHQWWGNLITCATWRDFWLNEGITTFMVATWKEHRFGIEAYRQELAEARRRLERARQIGFDKPLAWNGKYPSLGTRRAVQYSKGALFMADLRELIGERAFWAGLKSYTRRHAGGVVTSKDFQIAMEAASGRDLSPAFAHWVYSG